MLPIKREGIDTADLAPRWKVGVDHKQVALYVGIALIAGFAIGFMAARYSEPKAETAVLAREETEPHSAVPSASASTGEVHRVTKVLRGDSVEVEGVGAVRMVGIETPDGKFQYMEQGKRALAFTESHLLNKNVRIEFDTSSPDFLSTDLSNQKAAYIYIEDGTLFNAELLRQGHAFVRSSESHKMAEQFRALEREASLAMKGLWGTDDSSNTASAQTATSASSTSPSDKRKLSPMLPSDVGPNLPTLSSGTTPTPTAVSGPVVFISGADRLYHKPGCEDLGKRREAITASEARAKGYTACSRCFASTVLKAN
jgi:micrococcal nuclease